MGKTTNKHFLDSSLCWNQVYILNLNRNTTNMLWVQENISKNSKYEITHMYLRHEKFWIFISGQQTLKIKSFMV